MKINKQPKKNKNKKGNKNIALPIKKLRLQ
jgi:hypothetical protein